MERQVKTSYFILGAANTYNVMKDHTVRLIASN